MRKNHQLLFANGPVVAYVDFEYVIDASVNEQFLCTIRRDDQHLLNKLRINGVSHVFYIEIQYFLLFLVWERAHECTIKKLITGEYFFLMYSI